MTRLAKNTKYWVRIRLGSCNSLFPLLKLFPRFHRKMVSVDSDIVIEGFPRSANSFMLQAFRLWNPEAKVGHHIHVPLQVLRAVEYRIPCIVLIRDPIQALASLLIVDRSLSVRLAIKSYIEFYRRVLPFRDKVIVAEFGKTIQDPSSIIRAINTKYGTNFHCRPLEEEEKKKIFTELKGHHARTRQPTNLVPIPTELKEKQKMEVMGEICANALLVEAQKIYNEFKSFY